MKKKLFLGIVVMAACLLIWKFKGPGLIAPLSTPLPNQNSRVNPDDKNFTVKNSPLQFKASDLIPITEDRESFYAKYGSNWVERKTTSGRPKKIFGSKIPIGSSDGKRIAAFVKSVAPVFGLTEDNLSDRAKPIQGDPQRALGGSATYQMNQLYNGYPVLGGKVRVNFDLNSNSITGVDTTDTLEISGDVPKSVSPAKKIIEKLLKKDPSLEIQPRDSIPYVTNDKNGQPRLVYRFVPLGTVQPGSEELIADANTGEVIAKNPLVVVD